MSAGKRAERRRVLRWLRHNGCSCAPEITVEEDGPVVAGAAFGGWIVHEIGCVRPGDVVNQANRRGEFPALLVPPGTPVAGMSVEQIHHHARLHAEHCPAAGERLTTCPCDVTVAIICTSCGEPVFGAVASGRWCQHAEELAHG